MVDDISQQPSSQVEEEDSQPLSGFGDIETHAEVQIEGDCVLKTKADKYKPHWAMIVGNELFCYRHKGDAQQRVMHSLVGTFIKDVPPEDSKSEGCRLYPVKIMLPPSKSRVLYFKSQEQQQQWIEALKKTVGYSNLFDFYNLEESLGKGQFGLVKLASHRKTSQKVAIKTVHKKDMKPIEVL